MSLGKRTKLFLAVEMIFVLCGSVFICGSEAAGGYGSAFLLSVIQTGISVWGIIFIVIPVCRFEKAVKFFKEKNPTEQQLDKAVEGIPYFADIKVIVEHYAQVRTRKNSKTIYDKQSELTALQSQINPHFLYNTLESIRGQALVDDNIEIAKMVEALSSFFRYSISRKWNLVTLRDELASIRNYMTIQRYRFNNRFSLEIVLDDDDDQAYDYLIPKLIIQPVVENAIFHGLEEKLEGGTVTIEIVVTEELLMITVSDNGKGIESGRLKELNNRIHAADERMEEAASQKQSSGIALPNIHKRIQLLFGEEYGINVYSTAGQGTDVEITVPIKEKREESGESEARYSENK